jgi:NAD(P)H-dependent flavin oxidoreductase YrpB (nitropropane dioxygenase family)
MIVVHDIFICKPGNASKVAKLFKEWTEVATQKNTTVMTDMTGQYHRVIVAATFESLADYEEQMKTMGQTEAEKKLMEKFNNMNDMYVSGERQIFKVW